MPRWPNHKPKKEQPPFFREQAVARKMYNELMVLDRPARRRVLAIVNDYAMSTDRRGKQKEGEPDFVLDDEEAG